MADFGWVEDLDTQYVNIVNISSVWFNLDKNSELNFIFATTNNKNQFKLFDLSHVGDIVSTPSGNVTMTAEDAPKLVASTAQALESHQMLTNEEFKDILLSDLGNF